MTTTKKYEPLRTDKTTITRQDLAEMMLREIYEVPDVVHFPGAYAMLAGLMPSGVTPTWWACTACQVVAYEPRYAGVAVFVPACPDCGRPLLAVIDDAGGAE